jgi:hypothetical protein
MAPLSMAKAHVPVVARNINQCLIHVLLNEMFHGTKVAPRVTSLL